MKYICNWMKLALLITSAPLWASGFGLYEQGVVGQGNAGAFVARAEDGSALFYNPAGLAQSRFSEVAIAGRLASSRSFYSNAGQSTWRSEFEQNGLPTFFYNGRYKNFGFAIGSAVTYSYDLNWEELDYPGRFIYNQSSFEVNELMAGFGIKLSDSFSFGASIRQASLEYSLGSSLPRPISATNPGSYYETQELYEMDGDEIGFSAGLQYYKSRRLSMGVSYQSPIEIDLTGTRGFSQITGLEDQRAVNDFNGTFNGADAGMTLELPERFTVGFSTRVTVRTRVEVDATWEGWSSVESMQIATADSAGNAQDIIIPRQWDDTYTFRVAGDFQQKRALNWRIGLATIRSTVPESTFEPDFPDYDRFMYSFGVGYTFKKKYTVDLGWQLVQNRDRNLRDKELEYDPNAPDFSTPNGQRGVFESQRIQVQAGLRIRLGGPKE